MGSFAMTKRVEAPQHVVFDLATDLERAADHIDGIQKIEMLTDDPVGVGTRWRETRKMFGKEATEEMQVTSFEPPHAYSAGSHSCGCDYSFTFRFLPDGEATNVLLEVQWKALSLFAKLMSPLSMLMIGTMKKCVEQDLDDLKRTAEAQTVSSVG